MGFSADLSNFAKNTNNVIEQTRRNFIMKLFGQIIERTPVDEGRAINNWQTSAKQPIKSTLKGKDKTGAKALARVQNNLGEGDTTVYLTNNLPYIVALEGGIPSHPQGHSEQAREGMVRISIENIENNLKQAIAEA